MSRHAPAPLVGETRTERLLGWGAFPWRQFKPQAALEEGLALALDLCDPQDLPARRLLHSCSVGDDCKS